jgi:PAS domain S-box-containing protein
MTPPIDDSEKRKAFFAAIIDSSDDAIISKSLNSIITSWNKAAERMFGYAEEEVVGKHIFLIIPKDLQSEEEMIIANLRQGKRIEHFQTIRVTKSGQRLHISLTISPIRNDRGEIIGASKIARDITRQRRNEQTIQRYMHQLEVINEVGKKIATKLDTDSIMNLLISSTSQLSDAEFGTFFYRRKDAKGSFSVHHASKGLPSQLFEGSFAIRNTPDSIFEGAGVVHCNLNGSDSQRGLFPFDDIFQSGLIQSYLVIPVLSQQGEVVGKLFFAHHESHRFSEENIRTVQGIAALASIALDNANLYDELHLLNARKDEFIGFASHELKTPLTTLLGYVDLVKKQPENLDSYLPRIEKQALRLKTLISDLLDISQIHSGDFILKYSETTLKTLLKESLDSIKHETHDIQLELPEEDIQLIIDKEKILQVISNILGNAMKYSDPNTSVRVFTRLNDPLIEIVVRDQGSGITEEDLPNIFKQYYRSAKITGIPGMGLGLYISREIMKKHRGDILASSDGQGSTFRILLPLPTQSHLPAANQQLSATI